MANTDAIESVDETQLRFACPFFKAHPSIWIVCGECVSYSKQQLKKILIRHHFFTKHQKLNEKFELRDPRRIDPRIFTEASQWLKGFGRAQEDEVIWKFLYDKIAVAYGLSRSNPPDPYWTVQWLSTTLTALSPPRDGVRRTRTNAREATHTIDTISQLQDRVSAMGRYLENVEKLCKATCEDILSLQAAQKQMIPILDDIRATQESARSPSSLSYNPSDTQLTGTMFESQQNSSIPRGADFEMPDPSSMPFHADASHNDFDNFHPGSPLGWGDPTAIQTLNSSNPPYNAFTTGQGGQPSNPHISSHVTDRSTTHTRSSYNPYSEYSHH